MDFGIYAGDTNKTIYIRLRDSTTGLAKTGLVFNSAGAVCSYTLPLAARAAITLATQTVTGAHSDGGFVEVDATNCKGLYRLDLPDAAIASGDYTIISIEFDGIIEESIEIPLHTRKVNTIEWLGTAVTLSTGNKPDVNVDEWGDVLLATTNPLPNAVPGAAGGVFIAGTNAATTVTTSFTTTFTGNLTGSVGSVSGDTKQTADVASLITTVGIAGAGLTSLVDLVWDEALTGATHNVATSAGRRLRGIQDNQAYDDGAIWIDTVNGTAGTTVYENGTSGLPVSTIADAITLAAAANVKHLHVVNGSTITLAATMDNYELTGDEWGLAFGGQSCDGLSVHNAHLTGVAVTGIFSGNPHILHSTIGAITGPNARVGWCAITGTITSNGTGTWVIHSCWGLSGSQFDFGVGGAQTVYLVDWVGGPITIANMGTGDVLYFEGRSASLTLAASCTAGTVYLAGDIALTNSGSGQTINQSSRYEITRILADSQSFNGADVALILTDTGEIGTAGAGLTDITINAASVDAIWDEAITTAAHNGANSAGKHLRQAGTAIATDGAVNDLSATTTSFITNLTNATDSFYQDQTLAFTSGNLSGQARVITSYTGATKTVTFDEAFSEAPANDDDFVIYADHVHPTSDIAAAVLTTQMTESYAADGAAPTPAQSLMLIQQSLTEFVISGTTYTIKKVDGSTTAATLTLDDATNPTSATRAT